MGVVLKGRDNDLGRELAVKVLLDRYCDHPAMIDVSSRKLRSAGSFSIRVSCRFTRSASFPIAGLILP